MEQHEQLITTFYTAFGQRDSAGMAACYHPNVAFTDKAFGTLDAEQAKGMWRMLCERGDDLSVTFSDVKADEQTGSAHWEADYTFSQTGRKVHNVIEARFEFADGLIKRHTDTFNFHKWSSQALGAPGMLLGWAGPFNAMFQKKARAMLDAYLKR